MTNLKRIFYVAWLSVLVSPFLLWYMLRDEPPLEQWSDGKFLDRAVRLKIKPLPSPRNVLMLRVYSRGREQTRTWTCPDYQWAELDPGPPLGSARLGCYSPTLGEVEAVRLLREEDAGAPRPTPAPPF